MRYDTGRVLPHTSGETACAWSTVKTFGPILAWKVQTPEKITINKSRHFRRMVMNRRNSATDCHFVEVLLKSSKFSYLCHKAEKCVKGSSLLARVFTDQNYTRQHRHDVDNKQGEEIHVSPGGCNDQTMARLRH